MSRRASFCLSPSVLLSQHLSLSLPQTHTHPAEVTRRGTGSWRGKALPRADGSSDHTSALWKELECLGRVKRLDSHWETAHRNTNVSLESLGNKGHCHSPGQSQPCLRGASGCRITAGLSEHTASQSLATALHHGPFHASPTMYQACWSPRDDCLWLRQHSFPHGASQPSAQPDHLLLVSISPDLSLAGPSHNPVRTNRSAGGCW